jgi:hypothetical protein
VVAVADPMNLPTGISHHQSSASDTPALPSNYPNVKFWRKQDWINWGKSAKGVSDLNRKGPSERGKTRASQGENVKMQYIEDENGVAVDGHKASEIRRITRSIWAHLASIGKAPKTWTKIDIMSGQQYRQEMHRQFPELRLCELDWKADMIAIEYYPSWHNNHLKDGGTVKQEQSDNPIAHPPKRSVPPTGQQVDHPTKKKKVTSVISTTPDASLEAAGADIVMVNGGKNGADSEGRHGHPSQEAGSSLKVSVTKLSCVVFLEYSCKHCPVITGILDTKPTVRTLLISPPFLL